MPKRLWYTGAPLDRLSHRRADPEWLKAAPPVVMLTLPDDPDVDVPVLTTMVPDTPALVPPVPSITQPLSPDFECPLVMLTPPVLPDSADPDPIMTEPVVPEYVVPLLNTSDPLTPALRELPDTIVTDPLDDDLPSPDEIDTAPDTVVVVNVSPAFSTADPA